MSKKLFLIPFLVIVSLVLFLLWFHAVSNSITEEDEKSIPLFTKNIDAVSPESGFDRQIEFITKVQDSVQTIASLDEAIPVGRGREPADLFKAGKGLCYDRSRVIEKILRSHGFETRHIFVFTTKESPTAFRAFIKSQVLSYAVTEVKTRSGWLVVDADDRWISLDSEGMPKQLSEIQASFAGGKEIAWKSEPPSIYREITPFSFVYGLYSRHGGFYPPYNPIPDVNYGELIYNFY